MLLLSRLRRTPLPSETKTTVPDGSIEIIRQKALDGDVAVGEIDPETLHDRAVETTPVGHEPIDVAAAEVNYIRHQLVEVGGVPYERLASPLMEAAKEASDSPEETPWGKAYRDLKARVLDAIASRYPPCAEECRRQLQELEGEFGTPSDAAR